MSGAGSRRRQHEPEPVPAWLHRPRCLPEVFGWLTRGHEGTVMTVSEPSAYSARTRFLSNLPTVVFGTASMNAHRSGSCHCATLPARNSRSSAAVAVAPVAQHDRRQRTLAPPLVGHADHARLQHGRVGHQRVLQLHRGDPLAAGLDDVLGPVGERQVAVGRQACPRRRCAASRRGTSPGPARSSPM